jgi:hypothetical protein
VLCESVLCNLWNVVVRCPTCYTVLKHGRKVSSVQCWGRKGWVLLSWRTLLYGLIYLSASLSLSLSLSVARTHTDTQTHTCTQHVLEANVPGWHTELKWCLHFSDGSYHKTASKILVMGNSYTSPIFSNNDHIKGLLRLRGYLVGKW